MEADTGVHARYGRTRVRAGARSQSGSGQIGALTGVDIAPLYAMDSYRTQAEAEDEARFARSADEQARIYAAARESRSRLAGDWHKDTHGSTLFVGLIYLNQGEIQGPDVISNPWPLDLVALNPTSAKVTDPKNASPVRATPVDIETYQ